MPEMGQDDIDRLLSEALGGGATDDSSSDDENDNDLDQMLNTLSGDDSSEGAQSQDDIDALLADLTSGDDGEGSGTVVEDVAPAQPEETEEPEKTEEPAEMPLPEGDEGGMQSQDDIDALLSNLTGGGAEEASEEPAPPAPEEAVEEEGAVSQDSIDSLLAELGEGAAPVSEEEPAPATSVEEVAEIPLPSEPEEAPAEEAGAEAVDQDDIDALLASVNQPEAAAEEPAPPEAPENLDASLAEEASEPVSQDGIDALLSEVNADVEFDNKSRTTVNMQATPELETSAEAEPEEPAETPEPEVIEEIEEAPEPEVAEEVEEAPEEEALPEETPLEDEHLEELMASVAEDTAAETELPTHTFDSDEMEEAQEPFAEPESAALDELWETADEEPLEAVAQEEAPAPATPTPSAPPPAPAYSAPQPEYAAPSQPSMSLPPLSDQQKAEMAALRENLSQLESAGEIEGISGQIANLLGLLAERARRFQDAWTCSEHEARQLRQIVPRRDHRIQTLEAEKASLQEEINHLRSRECKLEADILTREEGANTKQATLEAKLRHEESRAKTLDSEVIALKEELTLARTESTNSDLACRRARFEADRIRGELDAERQERQRLQRALENREKELQAMQTQSAGEASSLFLDELHRLVRRLESELDVRTSAANEALNILDRATFPASNRNELKALRQVITAAAGLGDALDRQDTLKNLSKATPHKEPEQADPEHFAHALNQLHLTEATSMLPALFASEATPAELGQQLHSCAVLRQPDVGASLEELVTLLESLRDKQQQMDKIRGKETPDTERTFVYIFDLLHALVRQKIITRATSNAWQFFLDLRGRYSFVTSDRQWVDYRDSILGRGDA